MKRNPEKLRGRRKNCPVAVQENEICLTMSFIALYGNSPEIAARDRKKGETERERQRAHVSDQNQSNRNNNIAQIVKRPNVQRAQKESL